MSLSWGPSASADPVDLSGLSLFETVTQTDATHLRYVAEPEFGLLTYDSAFPVFQPLCEAPQDLGGTVVVLVMEQPIPFGEPLGELVSFAEMFTRDGAICTPMELLE